MQILRKTLSVLIAAACAGPVFAQQAPTRQIPRDIVVTAPRQLEPATPATIARAVETMTGGGTIQIPRWNGTLCIRGKGMPPETIAKIAQPIVATARALKIDVDAGRCRANVMIWLSSDPDALAQAYLRYHPAMLRDTNRYGKPHAREHAELLRRRPVRWTIGTTLAQVDGIASRIVLATQDDKTQVLAIIDLRDCVGLTWHQLGAYLTMVVLANPRHTGSMPRGSIMTLFDRDASADRPTTLTDLDHALLKALYATNGQRAPNMQRIDITRRIVEATDSGASSPAEPD